MDHELYTEWLHLSVFGELDPDKKAMLDRHIGSCNECRREREELVEMLDSITESRAGEPTDEQLITARQRLSTALWDEAMVDAAAAAKKPARRESIFTRWFGAGRRDATSPGRGGWFQGYRLGMAGAMTVLIGFFAGYLAFGGVQPVSSPPRTGSVRRSSTHGLNMERDSVSKTGT